MADEIGESPEARVKVDADRDYPLVYGESSGELSFALTFLHEQGWIENFAGGEFQIKMPGWVRVYELRETPTDSRRGFVAMSFDPSMDPVWKVGIAPAIVAAGYEPVRVDRVEHNDKICDRIVVEIRRARFVVADFTGHRQGVYFEAGFALGLGLPVIWLAREDALAEAHFDTRQYNHIKWKTPEELLPALRDRILATIGAGPAAGS